MLSGWLISEAVVRIAGVQSDGAAGEPQRHDQGGLHGAPQSLVLLHCAREGHLWRESNLGVQLDEEKGHRYTSARHRQVHSRTPAAGLKLLILLQLWQVFTMLCV